MAEAKDGTGYGVDVTVGAGRVIHFTPEQAEAHRGKTVSQALRALLEETEQDAGELRDILEDQRPAIDFMTEDETGQETEAALRPEEQWGRIVDEASKVFAEVNVQRAQVGGA